MKTTETLSRLTLLGEYLPEDSEEKIYKILLPYYGQCESSVILLNGGVPIMEFKLVKETFLTATLLCPHDKLLEGDYSLLFKARKETILPDYLMTHIYLSATERIRRLVKDGFEGEIVVECGDNVKTFSTKDTPVGVKQE